MQKTVLVMAMFIIGHVATFAQAVTRDDHRDLVERAQGLNTTMFLASLEKGNIDEAIDLIAPSFLRKKVKFRDSLTAYHKELSEVAGKTKLSIVVVTPDKNYNTYRCIYHNKKGDHFYLDLYYNKGETDSKIARIRKLPLKETSTTAKSTTKKETKKSGSRRSTKTTTTKGKRKRATA
jgi:hypothetical protein